MAHATLVSGIDADREYRLLQERLDRHVTGAPDSAAMRRILRLLFTPEDARVARHLPQLISLPDLAERLGEDLDQLDLHVTSMARRGLILDFERNGTRYAMATPVVIGFFEFVFMRDRPDEPMEDFAHAFEALFNDEEFARGVYAGTTQIGRSFVREEVLPAEVEVLDWERATDVVRSASSVTVSLCPCRSEAQFRGEGCDAPMRVCLSFGAAAEMLSRSGIGEAITNEEAMRILEEAKAAGLAQTGDNVRDGVTYMCNCCGCCCGMMRAVKQFGIHDGIVPSNWLATVDHSRCRGCSECAKACPADAIDIEPTHGKGLRRNWAVIDAGRCLGCGVCGDVCRYDAHGMEPRPERAYIPSDTMERVVLMAIERGKLGDLLYDNVGNRLGQVAAKALSVIERLPPWKAAMAADRLRSAFLATITDQLRARAPI